MRIWILKAIVLVLVLSCSNPAQSALNRYLDHLKSGNAEPYKHLKLDGKPLPFLVGPPIKARDDLFRMIVSQARIQTLSAVEDGSRVIYKVKIDSLDTESLLARTVVHMTVMQRITTLPIPNEQAMSVPFVEMHRLALLPDAPRKIVLSEIVVVQRDGEWTVEPSQAFIAGLFGFEGSVPSEENQE